MKRTFAVGALTAALALTATSFAGADPATVGPTGYKGLHMGQSAADGEATGLLVDKQPDGACTRYYLAPSEGGQDRAGGVWFDRNQGLVLLSGTDRTHTPEGITVDSTLDQVRHAYPDLVQLPPPEDHVYTTEVPGHPNLHYRFAISNVQTVNDYGINASSLGAC